MYKVAWIARYTASKPKAEADRYWAEVHGPLFAKVPGVQRYVQSHVTGPLPSVDGALPSASDEGSYFDGYSCAWFADRAAFEAAVRSPEWQAVVDDSPNVFDDAWFDGMSAHIDEVVQIEGDPGPYKAVWIVNFRDGMTKQAADDHWRTVHGPIFHGLPIDRYVQNHVAGAIGRDGQSDGDVRFSGFSECWFADEAQLLAALGSPGWAAAGADSPNVFDDSRMYGAVLREIAVKESQIDTANLRGTDLVGARRGRGCS
jgi:uncharacterized protein (TIGR02118 family)